MDQIACFTRAFACCRGVEEENGMNRIQTVSVADESVLDRYAASYAEEVEDDRVGEMRDPKVVLKESSGVLQEKQRGPSEDAQKQELKVIILEFTSEAMSGIPCEIYYSVSGNSALKTRATFVIDQDLGVVGFEQMKDLQDVDLQVELHVALHSVHAVDFDKLKKLRPQNVVLNAVTHEEQTRSVFLVRPQGTICLLASDDSKKLKILKSLQVLAARAKAHHASAKENQNQDCGGDQVAENLARIKENLQKERASIIARYGEDNSELISAEKQANLEKQRASLLSQCGAGDPSSDIDHQQQDQHQHQHQDHHHHHHRSDQRHHHHQHHHH